MCMLVKNGACYNDGSDLFIVRYKKRSYMVYYSMKMVVGTGSMLV